MTENDTPSRSRWRPRFSLLTALLLMTIVGLTIVMVQLWREVGPLREANRSMRAMVGQLTIEDKSKVYGLQIPTLEENRWRWQIYLPPGGRNKLYAYSGHLPSLTLNPGKAWFDAVRRDSEGTADSLGGLSGEILVDCQLVKENGKWLLAKRYLQRDSNSMTSNSNKSSISQPNGDWLTDRRGTSSRSLDEGIQQSAESGEPMLLLLFMRPFFTKEPGGGESLSSPSGAADGIAIWIEGSPRK